MTSKTASKTVDLRDLRLEDARALLGHSEQVLPDVKGGVRLYLQAVIDKLCELSLQDPLTGLANRRYFNNVLAREIEVVTRSGEPALLLMLDIDHFKIVNDTHGHPVGDLVLQAVAHTLASCIRPIDTLARFGGEEFVIILPNCQGCYGLQVAERLRQSISVLAVPIAPKQTLSVTVSVGGAYAPRWVRSTPELWLDRADIELYQAKKEGRNRVCIEAQPVMSVSPEEKSLLFASLDMDDAAWTESLPKGGSVGSVGSSGSTLSGVN